MRVTAEQVADYICQYILAYRQEYQRFTSPPPAGGGYPQLETSPYVYSPELLCFLSADGITVLDSSRTPAYQWWIAGGPAIMADFPETRTPPEIVDLLKRENLWQKPIGIARVVSPTGLSDEIWNGVIDPPEREVTAQVDKTIVRVQQMALTQIELLQRLTFGALGLIIDVHLPQANADFWVPHIIRDMGFMPADRRHRRFVTYLALSPHTDLAAWDQRSIATRVQVEVRRDFAWALALAERGGGGTLSLGVVQASVQPYYDRLSRLAAAIDGFASLLTDSPEADESVFHNFLRQSAVLLDVYGEAISNPRFVYPAGSSPLGKIYVEPDFIIRYPGNTYKLIELEKPGKLVATVEGQPRAGVTQATFQIAEWRAFIVNHYDRIKDQFPGIATSHTSMVVISRTTARSFGEGREVAKYMELVRTQFGGIDILTYDDLIERARQAYTRLATLGIR